MNKIEIKEIKETTIGEVEYEISPSVSEGFKSEEDHAKCITHELNLRSGEIYFDGSYFEVTGITKGNNHITITQDGEFNMYGGPYEPKMSKPTILVNGKDMYEQVRKEFEDYGWIGYGTDEIDVTRADIWGYLLK
jgi:hypothetical protein